MAKTPEEIRQEEFRIQQIESDERERRARQQDEEFKQQAMQNAAARSEVMASEALRISDLVKTITVAAIAREGLQAAANVANGHRSEIDNSQIGPATLLAELQKQAGSIRNPSQNGLPQHLENAMDDVSYMTDRQESQLIRNDTPAGQPERPRQEMRPSPGM